ncbi:zinc finger CCCH domain-containing protein 13-like isoform X2 [Penaeus japonicus]|uniref:zinc finger CCCH domain-containing protein 13-like isoform X2 n=1 Tax=Penaeus japonicus TaxID=27405 RepID=UPI001C70BEB7|nr:zinc finger CCCH domain-containing protein 13-like isoform X2 [Penaeus japonicus]
MPMVRPAGPPEPRNHARVVRTESLKSERSDKRVSFNKDVGVKHIPRGQKPQQIKNNLVRAPQEDEWAHCAAVHREPVNLSSRELEQQAEDLVKLLDHVNCDTAGAGRAHNTRSLDRPKHKNNKNFAHHHYNNVIVNNVRNNAGPKNTNVLNGEPRGRPRTLPPARTANPINRRIKSDVNRAAHPSPQPLPNGGPLAHRHRSADHLPDSDLDSPPLTRRPHPLAGHKSVPDLNTVYYDNNEAQSYKYQHLGGRDQDPVIGYKSVDSLYDRDEHSSKLNRGQSAGYKSVDNLTEHSQVSGGRLQGFKSVGHLPTTTFSDSDDADMSRPKHYKTKVGNIIKKFNAEADGTRPTNVLLETEMDISPRGTLEPDRFRNHNNNQPFSYTGSLPMATVQTVRRLSPTRDLPPRASPPRDSPPRDTPVYAQVNKRDARDAERNYRNARQEREYSAKIIITDDDHRPYQDQYEEHFRDAHPKNHYQEDDDAYESYQVPEDNLKRLLHEDIMPARMLSSEDLLEEYKEQSNNNINMSSVGVQTDALPKAPSRSRKAHKNSSPSPTRQHQSQQKQYQVKTQHIKNEQKHHQNYHYEREPDHYPSPKHHQRGGNIHNNLTSATLVRQVNHGFGRTDRSPSPPLRRPQARQPRRNVVPLLSDTSDSEAEHRRRTVDPLARIRDQVMQREKLQEEEEEEEEAARNGRIGIKESGVIPYRPEEMMPLTIDEVDALSLVMEDTGKKSLVVSNQSQSTSVTRTTNHRSRRSETVTERVHSQPHKDSLPRPQKPPREKNHAIREATPTRGHREQTPTRGHRETTPTRGHRETTPTRGHREPTPTRGHRETTPTRLPREVTPTRGHRETTPTRGHRETTPTRAHREGTSSRPREQRKDPPTMERNRKNNLEKERAAKASKQKEEKKEKKKKRIKIKFFYDPRPQDEPDVDPLAKFTEFRGSSSEERPSPRDERRPDDAKEEFRHERAQRDEYHRSEQKEVREDSRPRRGLPDVLEDTTSLRDRRGSREQLNRSREQLSKSREQLNRSRERLDRSREHLDRSRERLDATPRQVRHSSRDVRETKTREVSVDTHNGYGTKRRDSKDSRDSRDNRNREAARSRSRDDLAAYDESPDERRTDHDDQHRDRDYDDENDERGSPDGRPGRSLSDKYRSGPLYDPPEPEDAPPAELIPHTEDEEKQEKILRQRKKFFSVLMSDGRNKNAKTKTNEKATKTVKTSKKPPAPQPSAPPTAPPTAHAEKAKNQGQPLWFNRERDEEAAEAAAPPQWESSTLNRAELRAKKDARQGDTGGFSTVQRPSTTRKYSAESSASSEAPPPPRVARTTSFKHRYFGDTDIESSHGIGSGPAVPDYRSLPNRSSRSAHKNAGKGKRATSGPRGVSPPSGVAGSAGSSLQSSESEVDSHGGSHASRASKASRVSTGSNRSVYLHATAVADIPVRRASEEAPSERGVNRQSKKVSRSFSLLAPWKPRHYREKYEVEYDNREARDARGEANNSKGALPPRPPRRPANDSPDSKKVNRSQSMYKDSRLAGWLRRRRNKEAKGI